MNLNATLIFQMIVFFVLAWVTMKFIWPPLIKAIDERRQTIADGLAAAEKGVTDLAQTQTRITAMEEAAKSDLQVRINEADRQGAQIIAAAREEAEAERARILEQARQEANLEMQRARDELRDEVAVLAIEGASQILRREVDATVHAELLAQLKAQL